MEKAIYLAALQQAIKKDGRGPRLLALKAGVSEANVRTVLRGHCPDVGRSDRLLRALGRKVVIGRGKRLEMS